MIYLSSYRFGDNADVLRTGGGRAEIITNALDIYGETRLINRDREAGDLERLGNSPEELDLRVYFDDSEGLARRLETLDLVWTVGGNSFVVRARTASDFRKALLPALKRRLTYSGYSAGACVAGTDLRGIELIDDPDALPPGYDADMPIETLGLIPFRNVPHVDSDHPESADAARAVAMLDREGLAFRILRDGEALLVDDGGIRT